MSFGKKTVVVVGGGGGLGSATAQAFAKAGAEIIIMELDLEKCQVGAKALTDAGLPAPRLMVPMNVGDANSVAEAFKAVDAAGLKVDNMVIATGVREIKNIYNLPPEEYLRVVTVNLCGTYYCCREAVLRMKETGGGNIAIITSVAGITGLPNRPAYCSTKHGIVGLTRNLAMDLGPDNIRVNAIAPGTVRTPLTEAYYSSQAFLDGLDELVPAGHAKGGPGDVAQAAMFLCSDAAEFITGICLTVDGGWSAGKSYAIGKSTPYSASSSGN